MSSRLRRGRRIRPSEPRSQRERVHAPGDRTGARRGPGPLRRIELSPRGWVWILVALYAVIFSTVSIVKYRFYLYTDIDLAIFSQSADQAFRGSGFNTIRGMNWLGDHSSFVIYLIAPLYAVFRNPILLLVVQSVGLALGAPAVYRIALRALEDARLALLFAALYLLYPAVGYSNLFEFHPETLCTTSLLCAFDALMAGRMARLMGFATLSLLGREEVGFSLLGLAAYALTLRRPRRWPPAVGLVALAVASLALTYGWIKPTLSHGEAEFGLMFARWGSTPGQALLSIVRHPLAAVGALFVTPGNAADTLVKQQYYLQMLLPLAFLPLLAPAPLLGALPVLWQHFLSSRPAQHAIVYHYPALVSPFVIAAAALGARVLLRHRALSDQRRAVARRVLILVALGASLSANLLFGPLLGHHVLQAHFATERNWPTVKDRTTRPYRDRLVARVPRNAGVVSSFEYLSHLASRADVQSFHHIYGGHYTFSSKRYPIPTGIGALLTALGDQYQPEAAERVVQLIRTNQLRPVDGDDDELLFLRGASDTLDLLTFGEFQPQAAASITYNEALSFLGCDLLDLAPMRGGELRFRTYWRLRQPNDQIFLTRLWIFDDHRQVVFFRTRYLGYVIGPVAKWPVGAMARETYRLVIPVDLAPGRYQLVMQVANRNATGAEPSQPDDPALARLGGFVTLGAFDVN